MNGTDSADPGPNRDLASLHRKMDAMQKKIDRMLVITALILGMNIGTWIVGPFLIRILDH